MEDFVSFGTRTHALLFLMLLVARGMDFLSTWVATPNMVLEGNPIAKKLGWHWGIPVNFALCFIFAFWPLPAIASARLMPAGPPPMIARSGVRSVSRGRARASRKALK